MGFLSVFLRTRPPPAMEPTPLFFVPAELPRIGAPTALVARRAGLMEVPPASPSMAVDLWLGAGRYVDVLGFLAHGLPSRDGVRWAVSACERAGGSRTPIDGEALAACRGWMARPEQASVERAAKAAAATAYASPAGWAAQAASWSGPAPAATKLVGSEGPLSANAVLGAVMLAAAAKEAPDVSLSHVAQRSAQNGSTVVAVTEAAAVRRRLAEIYRPFLELGLAIAAGR